ncbi:MAG: DUF4349 domain-containing protein [Planctomycetes bacterium]|nr:DUF4349 domain-containing protein [Planctomycetota bacterium]
MCLFLPVLGAVACAADRESARGRPAASQGFAADEAAPAPAEPPQRMPFNLGSGGWDDRTAATSGDVATNAAPTTPEPNPADRMLIQTGQVRVEVARPDEVMTSFRTQVAAWGGHLSSQSDQTLVVRVPAQRFDEAFEWVKNSGRVLAESRRAQDVTEEFLDLGIRIENARKSRERLLEILQQADKVEDILKVETELRRLTEEIERMEGRKKFLADQVALATLSATFESVATPPPAKRRRQPSRFDWINRIGAERVMEDF